MEGLYFNQRTGARAIRNATNVTADVTNNRNGVFKVPKAVAKPQSVSQALYSNAVNNESCEISAMECLKPIGEKFEVIERLKLLPFEEIQQISQEFVQQLDSLCMEKITQQVLQKPVAAISQGPPSTIFGREYTSNSIRSHRILPQPDVVPLPLYSLPSTSAQTEIEYVSDERKNYRSQAVSERVPEKSKNSRSQPVLKAIQILPSDDENDSIASFFKKNQTKKVTKSQPVTTSTLVAKTKETQRLSSPKKQIQQKSQTSRKPELAHANGSRKGQSSDVLVEPSPMISGGPAKRTDTQPSKYKEAVSGVRVVLNRVKEPAKKTPQKRKTTTEMSEQTHKKRTTGASQEFGGNLLITKNSLRNSMIVENNKKPKAVVNIRSTTQKSTTSKRKTKNGPSCSKDTSDALCGHEQEDEGMFGNVSSIIGTVSFQESLLANGDNITKISTNRTTNRTNDMNMHLFAQCDANMKSVCGISAVSSTPLSKTLTKNVLNKRVKKPDVAAELKPVHSRKPQKRPQKRIEIINRDVEDDDDYESVNETSDFTDTEEFE